MTRTSLTAATLALLFLGSAATAATEYRIDCGDTDVILTEEQAETITAVNSITDISSQEYATAVCDLFKDVATAGMDDPTDVTVLMPNGSELHGKIQASQQ